MQYELKAISDAFTPDHREKYRYFPLFAFILCDDRTLLEAMVIHFRSIDLNTTGRVLVIPASTMQVSEMESRETIVSNDKAMSEWHAEFTEASYSFAERFGLRREDIPCVLLFDRLEETTQFIRLPLKDLSGSDVLHIFRQISDVVDTSSREANLLQAIKAKRFRVQSEQYLRENALNLIQAGASLVSIILR